MNRRQIFIDTFNRQAQKFKEKIIFKLDSRGIQLKEIWKQWVKKTANFDFTLFAIGN